MTTESHAPSSNTCLFTGANLDTTTRVEHTILRGLGGRVRSRIVCCDALNNRCGSLLDPFLLAPYLELMAILGPMLAAEHRSGSIPVTIPEEEGARFSLDGFGVLQQQGPRVVGRDEHGRPTAVQGANQAQLQNIVDQVARGIEPTWSTVSPTTAPFYFRNRPVVLAEIEIAALKCALLTFDHLLADHPFRFTRTPELEPVLRFVRECLETGDIDGELLNRYSLGVQYESLRRLEVLRSQFEPPAAPFEHILVAVGNVATRTLDVVWHVLGVDPFGFRLSRTWRQQAFTCVVVNQIQQGGRAHGPIWWEGEPPLLCAPTNRRAFPDCAPAPDLGQQIVQEISNVRLEAAQRAVRLVEATCDDHVIAMLQQLTQSGTAGDNHISSAVRERLRRLYSRRIEENEANRRLFEEHVNPGIAQLPDDEIDEEGSGQVDWQLYLRTYRELLQTLSEKLGHPGEFFSNRTDIGFDVVANRQLGDDPRQE